MSVSARSTRTARTVRSYGASVVDRKEFQGLQKIIPCSLTKIPNYNWRFTCPARLRYIVDISESQLFCNSCRLFFVSINDYYRHKMIKEQISKAKKEFQYMSITLRKIGYNVSPEGKILILPPVKTQITEQTSRKQRKKKTNFETAAPLPETLTEQKFFEEQKFIDELRTCRRKTEKLRRHFKAFRLD